MIQALSGPSSKGRSYVGVLGRVAADAPEPLVALESRLRTVLDPVTGDELRLRITCVGGILVLLSNPALEPRLRGKTTKQIEAMLVARHRRNPRGSLSTGTPILASVRYWPSGPDRLSYTDAAAVLTKVLGRPITYNPLTFEEQKEAMVNAGLPEPVAAMNAQALGLFAEGDAPTESMELQPLLSRPLVTAEWSLRPLSRTSRVSRPRSAVSRGSGRSRGEHVWSMGDHGWPKDIVGACPSVCQPAARR